jgi:RimJ/RimL family protein N-acetyltransferase
MEVTLRPVKKTDFKKILEWRNEPEVRGQMFNSKLISWSEHATFWNKIIEDKRKYGFIISAEGEDCGVIRFDVENNEAEIDIFISKKFHGKGIGTKALEKSIKEAKKLNLRSINARIKPQNYSSIKAFEKNGFVPKCIYYELEI